MSIINDRIYKAAHVKPSERQIAWQQMEFYGFVHFTVNTFTDQEWGMGTESPAIFNPSELDTRQWVIACRDAGMTGVILTAKHHDGFCLWPSQYTEHSVKNSPWKNGQGDVVDELANACREYGLKLGIYLSPWDRHDPRYGTDQYNEYFKNQLRELLTNYGELFIVWFDGACGEGPNGKRQVYDWEGYYKVIRELQPKACISVCGPDVRWVGNEAGKCREAEWSVLPVKVADNDTIANLSQQVDDGNFAPQIKATEQDLGSRQRIKDADMLIWYPAEVDVSIRPGWFYHTSQDDKVRSLESLLEIYLGSVGGNASLLLNIPPDTRGLFHENDVKRLSELGETIRAIFANNLCAQASAKASSCLDDSHQAIHATDGHDDTFWCPEQGVEQAHVMVDLGCSQEIGFVLLQEQIREGQRIERFNIDVLEEGKWHTIYQGTTVGYKKICRFDAVWAQRIRIDILESRWCPTLKTIAVYAYHHD